MENRRTGVLCRDADGFYVWNENFQIVIFAVFIAKVVTNSSIEWAEKYSHKILLTKAKTICTLDKYPELTCIYQTILLLSPNSKLVKKLLKVKIEYFLD